MPSREQYRNWLKSQGYASSSISKYSDNTANNLEVQNVVKRVTGSSNMYNCASSSQIETVINIVEGMTFDIVGHKMYSNGLKKYLKYLREG